MNNIFKTIDTEETAYILGFIAADGCVSSTTNNIRIELKNEPSEVTLLQKIHNILKLKTKITFPKNRNSCLLYFSNSEIKQTLAQYNITAKKTFTVSIPNLPSNLFRHYIRGYFDGDGWVSYSKPNNNSYICAGFIANKRFADELNQILKKEIGITLSTTPNKTMIQLACSGCDKTYKLLNYLYKDASIYLHRKQELYINLHNFINEKQKEALQLTKLACPFCKSQSLKKNGSKKLKSASFKRYKCSTCSRSTIHPVSINWRPC